VLTDAAWLVRVVDKVPRVAGLRGQCIRLGHNLEWCVDKLVVTVRVGDNLEADNVFSVLMGDNVEPRREFITNNALNARNLDI
jgi:hypothetical protein